MMAKWPKRKDRSCQKHSFLLFWQLVPPRLVKSQQEVANPLSSLWGHEEAHCLSSSSSSLSLCVGLACCCLLRWVARQWRGLPTISFEAMLRALSPPLPCSAAANAGAGSCHHQVKMLKTRDGLAHASFFGFCSASDRVSRVTRFELKQAFCRFDSNIVLSSQKKGGSRCSRSLA